MLAERCHERTKVAEFILCASLLTCLLAAPAQSASEICSGGAE